jgi:hypothetical protein
MEQDATRKLTKSDVTFLLLFGAFQGALVAFLITLSNWHHDGHGASRRNTLGMFIISVVIFALGSLALRILFPRGLVPRTPTGARIRTVVFFALMAGLVYVCWKTF